MSGLPHGLAQAAGRQRGRPSGRAIPASEQAWGCCCEPWPDAALSDQHSPGELRIFLSLVWASFCPFRAEDFGVTVSCFEFWGAKVTVWPGEASGPQKSCARILQDQQARGRQCDCTSVFAGFPDALGSRLSALGAGARPFNVALRRSAGLRRVGRPFRQLARRRLAPAVLVADLDAELAGEPHITFGYTGGLGGVRESKAD